MASIHDIKELLEHANKGLSQPIARVIFEDDGITVQKRDKKGDIHSRYISWLQFDTATTNPLIAAYDLMGDVK